MILIIGRVFVPANQRLKLPCIKKTHKDKTHALTNYILKTGINVEGKNDSNVKIYLFSIPTKIIRWLLNGLGTTLYIAKTPVFC